MTENLADTFNQRETPFPGLSLLSLPEEEKHVPTRDPAPPLAPLSHAPSVGEFSNEPLRRQRLHASDIIECPVLRIMVYPTC